MSLVINENKYKPVGVKIYEKIIPSNLKEKDALSKEISDLLITNEWVLEKEEYWLSLCLDEIIVNAILHGNEGDHSLRVFIDIYDYEDKWIMVFSDQGDGFVKEDVPNPEDEDSLFLEHGRGLLIMTQWLDKLEYYNSGSTAVLVREKGKESK